MVKGIDVFQEYYKEYADQYVLIGGAACSISFEEQDISFRATKDLDMVLIIDYSIRLFTKENINQLNCCFQPTQIPAEYDPSGLSFTCSVVFSAHRLSGRPLPVHRPVSDESGPLRSFPVHVRLPLNIDH